MSRGRLVAILSVLVLAGGIALWQQRPRGQFQGSIPAGLYPSAIALDTPRGRAFVVNQLSGGHGVLIAIDYRTGSVVRTLRMGDFATSPVVDARTGRVYVATQGYGSAPIHGDLSAIDARDGTIRWRVPLPVGLTPESVAIDTRDDHIFVVGNIDYPGPVEHGMVLTLNGATGALLQASGLGRVVENVLVDEVGGAVLVSGFTGDGRNGLVGVLDPASGDLLRVYAVGAGAGAMALNARSGRMLVANRDGTLSVLDLRQGTMRTLTAPTEGDRLAIAQSTGLAFILDPFVNSVEVRDARGTLLRMAPVGQSPAALAVDEQARRVLVANQQSDDLTVLDARTGAVLSTMTAGPTPIALAIDEGRGVVLVVDNGPIHTTTPQPWWQRWLPWLPFAPRPDPTEGSVRVIAIR